jgi:3-dehydroquinate synthase
VAKICYAKDPAIFNTYTSLKPSAAASLEEMQSIIGLALGTKKWFIEVDEFDRKERLLLNFGHTFGHAIEAATNFDVHHGIGVGAGMLIAAEYARSSGMLNAPGDVAVIGLVNHIIGMLITNHGIALGAPEVVNLDITLEKFEYDKKHKTNAYRIVLPTQDGRLELISVSRDKVQREKIKKAYEAGFKALGWNYH